MVIHVGNIEDDMSNRGELPPAAISALQRSPIVHALFSQLGFNKEVRKVATEALVSITFNSGTYCLTAEAHTSRAFLETTNAITFIDEDTKVQHLDHSRPLNVAT